MFRADLVDLYRVYCFENILDCHIHFLVYKILKTYINKRVMR